MQDGFDPFEMDRARMAAFLDDIRAARERGDIARRAEQFLAYAVANSFPGRFTDPTDAYVMGDENLDRVAAGLLAALDYRRRHAPA